MASKTTPVSINGAVFHMTESAYQMFSDYLKSVQKHFSKHEGRDEIVTDLESRMAEHFAEGISPGKQVLLKKDIEALIEVMGRVEDFEAEEAQEEKEGESGPKIKKHFYRDPDKRVIAGVCSGLANYFQVDVRLFRLLFFVSIFFGGLGIFAYGLLWIFVAEAQTTAEKEAMTGYKFDLAAIAKDVEGKVKDIKMPEGLDRKIGGIFKGLGQLVTALVEFVLKFILFILKIVSIFVTPILILATVAFTLMMLALAFHLYPYFIQLPLDALTSRASFYLFLMGVYMAGLVVFIALISVFMSPIKKRWLFTAGKGVALISLFLVGGLITALGALDLAPRAREVMQKELNNESKEIQIFDQIPSFDYIYIQHPVRQATVVPGEKYKIEIKSSFCEGLFEPQVIGVTLEIKRKKILPFNPLCEAAGMDVVITAPDFETLSAWDSSVITVKDFDFRVLNLGLYDNNQLHLEGGNAEALNAYISGSSLILGLPFKVKEAYIDAFDNSMVELSVTDSLYGRAYDSSVIRYKGNPRTSFSEEADEGIAKFDSLGNIQGINEVPPTAVIEAENSFDPFGLDNEAEEAFPSDPMAPPDEQMAPYTDQPSSSYYQEISIIWSELEAMTIPQLCKKELRAALEKAYGDWIFSKEAFNISQSDLQYLSQKTPLISTSCVDKITEKIFGSS